MKPRFLAVALLLGIPGGLLGTAHWPSEALPAGVEADRVVVRKGARELVLLQGGEVLKRYRIALGRNPVGAKTREGDGRTPEGRYVLDDRNPHSAFHLSLHVSYPNAGDEAGARSRGESPGGLIMVHGLPNGLGIVGRWHTLTDWTNGCIAVTHREIEEIWRAVPDGTVIEIEP